MDIPWTDLAACATTNPDAFFPKPTDSIRKVLAICAGCEVRAECLTEALEMERGRNHRYGIFGGKTVMQRWQMDRARREAHETETA